MSQRGCGRKRNKSLQLQRPVIPSIPHKSPPANVPKCISRPQTPCKHGQDAPTTLNLPPSLREYTPCCVYPSGNVVLFCGNVLSEQSANFSQNGGNKIPPLASKGV